MAHTHILAYAFNRGIISRLGLARFDLKRLALSAAIQTNWMPRTLGSMMLRPGLGYVDSVYENLQAYHIPFIYSVSDTAAVELTDNLMRVRVNEVIITRPAVTSTITNGNFTTDLSGWTDADDAGGTSVWAAGPYMSLKGNGTARAVRYQTVAVSGGNVNTEHALRIIVAKGYVTLRVGTTAGDDSYIKNTVLAPGVHSLALSPAGNFTIQVSSATVYTTLISSITLEAAGDMTIPTPWPLEVLAGLRWDQSADVVEVASGRTIPQQLIERRGTGTASHGRSWSIVGYLTDDGPFLTQNIDTSIALTSSGLNGDVTLSSSIPFFKTAHVGTLFRLASQSGATVTKSISGNAQWSDPILVTGIQANGGRNLTINISNTWSGVIKLQYSVGAPGAWVDSGQTYTTNQSNRVYNDGFDNQLIYYRIGFDAGYVSGTADVQLDFAVANGAQGIIRIDSFTNSQSVAGHVLSPIGSTTPTTQWSQGLWSGIIGYPSAVTFYEGRLWWLGNDYIAGSVSDAYKSFDDTVVGNSGPIIRTIAQGPVSNINWALGLQRLVVGCDGSEQSVRSDSLDTPLTPTNFNIKSPSTRGSAAVAAQKIDTNGVYVQRGDPDGDNTFGSRLIQIAYQGTYAIIDYTTSDLSEYAPELVAIGIKRIAVQRKIDTRIHCLLYDGTVAVLVYDPVENMKCWVLVTTDGQVEDIYVLPGAVEDKVYYVVNRLVKDSDGFTSTVRYLERWAMESECVGGQLNKNSDSHIFIHHDAPSNEVTVPHLAGRTITVWADGKDVGTQEDGTQKYTLDNDGTVLLDVQFSNAIVGLYYEAKFQTVKLTQTVQDGTSMGMVRSIDQIGVVLDNTHYQGLKYGPDFDSLEPLPLVEDGQVTPADTIWDTYDKESFEFNGSWDTDSRLCLFAAAPRPCTILCANIGVTTSGG